MKITKLTKEQEAEIPKFVERVRDSIIGKKTDRKKVKTIIKQLDCYKGRNPKVLFFSSPLLCHLALLSFRSQLGSQLYSQLNSQLYSQLDSQLDSQLYSQLNSQLYSQLDSQLDSQLYSQLDSQLSSQLYSQLDSQLGSQLSSQLDSQLRSQLYSQLGSQLDSQLDSQLGSQLRSQLDSQLNSQLYSQLDSQLGSQLRSQLGSQLSSQLFIFWRLIWIAWKNYVEYIGGTFDLPKLLIDLVENVFFMIPYENYVFISEFPKDIKWQNQRLHSSNGMACEFKDGWGVYSLNGIRFEKELFEKLTSHKMSFAEILAITDVDQRNQAMRFVGKEEREKFLEYVKAEVIDSYVKYTLEGKGVKYRLYKLPKGEIFAEDTYAMWYECPSNGLDNFSGVPKFKTVAEAMAWKGSDEVSIISPEDWQNAIPLIDES